MSDKQQEYSHHTPNLPYRHKKWDVPGQGEHDAYCPKCRRTMRWSPTRKTRDG